VSRESAFGDASNVLKVLLCGHISGPSSMVRAKTCGGQHPVAAILGYVRRGGIGRDAAKKLENYNAQLVAEMIERQQKVSTISTTVN